MPNIVNVVLGGLTDGGSPKFNLSVNIIFMVWIVYLFVIDAVSQWVFFGMMLWGVYQIRNGFAD